MGHAQDPEAFGAAFSGSKAKIQGAQFQIQRNGLTVGAAFGELAEVTTENGFLL